VRTHQSLARLAAILFAVAPSSQAETPTTRTVCIGRYLIDVPANIDVIFRSVGLGPWQFETMYDRSDEEFKAFVAETQTSLKERTNRNKSSSLIAASPIFDNPDKLVGMVFYHNPAWGDDAPTTVTADAYLHSGRNNFAIRGQAILREDSATLPDYVRRLSIRPGNALPAEQGFCIDRGFLGGPPTPDIREEVYVLLQDKARPEIQFSFDMAFPYMGRESLFKQHSKEYKDARAYGIALTELRRAVRPIAGAHGEELIHRLGIPPSKRRPRLTAYELTLQAEADSGANTPAFEFHIKTGTDEHGTVIAKIVPEAELIRLWDQITSSLRPHFRHDKPMVGARSGGGLSPAIHQPGTKHRIP
jgi:hypothetical protein